jgi:hypothetical protein
MILLGLRGKLATLDVPLLRTSLAGVIGLLHAVVLVAELALSAILAPIVAFVATVAARAVASRGGPAQSEAVGDV